MSKCLFVRPARSAEAAAGDEVVYRRSIQALERLMPVTVLQLRPIGGMARLLAALRGAPLEATRYVGSKNRAMVREALSSGDFSVAVFSHEATFSAAEGAADADTPRVLVAHNVHSEIARTDPSWLGKALRPFAVAFERRFYTTPSVRLVCLSRADIAGLRRAGVNREDIVLSQPGAPPSRALSGSATVAGELVLTGSYGWWRKRRDLAAFAAEAGPDTPLIVTDSLAARVLGSKATLVEAANINWDSHLRVGVITDRFLGGFKLKSVEYVALNCVVASYCDLSSEFMGLPHAEEFVRHIRTRIELTDLLENLRQQPADQLRERFLRFKTACLERYEWDRCLTPFIEAVQKAAIRPPRLG